jgi:hypothetical protein
MQLRSEFAGNVSNKQNRICFMQSRDALEYHPLATLFPPLDDAEFEALKENIRENGLREEIWLYEGKILDETHRYKACLAVGVAPRFRDYEGGEPLAFVLGLNLRRCHLTTNLRAMLAARVMTELEAAARVNMSRGGQGLADLPRTHSRDGAAAVVGVASRLVGLAAQILDRGMPELIAAVVHDAIKVSTVAVVATLDNAELDELLAKGPKAVRQRAAQLRRAKKDDQHHGPAPEDETRTTQPVPGPAGAVGDDPILREWLEGLPLWDQLADRSTFIREAVFWKDAQPLLDRIRREFPSLDEKSPERVAHFSIQLVSHVFCVHHPSLWKLCSSCNRTGESNDPRCSACLGRGFEITKRGLGEPPSTLVG